MRCLGLMPGAPWRGGPQESWESESRAPGRLLALCPRRWSWSDPANTPGPQARCAQETGCPALREAQAGEWSWALPCPSGVPSSWRQVSPAVSPRENAPGAPSQPEATETAQATPDPVHVPTPIMGTAPAVTVPPRRTAEAPRPPPWASHASRDAPPPTPAPHAAHARAHAHTHSNGGAGEVPQVGSHHQWSLASGRGQARESASPPWPQPRPRASRAHILAASSYPLLSGAPTQRFCHSRRQQTLYTEQPLLPRWAGTQDTVRGALSWRAGVQQQLWSPCTL